MNISDMIDERIKDTLIIVSKMHQDAIQYGPAWVKDTRVATDQTPGTMTTTSYSHEITELLSHVETLTRIKNQMQDVWKKPEYV